MAGRGVGAGGGQRPRAGGPLLSSPYSWRHDHSRRLRWCSGYSWVMPMAPWAWWAARVAVRAALSASTLAAAISKGRGAARRARRRRRGHQRPRPAGADDEMLLDGLELRDRLAELPSLARCTRRSAGSSDQSAPAISTARVSAPRCSASGSTPRAPAARRRPVEDRVSRGSPARFVRRLDASPRRRGDATTGLSVETRRRARRRPQADAVARSR